MKHTGETTAVPNSVAGPGAEGAGKIAADVHVPAPACDAVPNFEKQFEDEFTTHLKGVNHKRQLQFSAIGAGLAGAIGLVAAPAVLPGLAVAAVAGGTGAYQLAKRKGKKDLQKHGARNSSHAGSCDAPDGIPLQPQRPTLRRLTYLVKWGHWQLSQYEEAPRECRAAVLNEVIRPFSPWVQRIYLLNAHRTCSEANPDAQEVYQHLGPLYRLVQRRAAFDALLNLAEDVGQAVAEKSLDASHVEHCQVVFPVVLETISFLDRLSQKAKAQLIGTVPTPQKGRPPNVRRSVQRHRLQMLVARIREVSERPDVAEAVACAQHRGQRAPVSVPLDEEVVAAGEEEEEEEAPPSTSPRNIAPVVVPPEGVEDEDGLAGASGCEQVYYSCSGESDDDAPCPSLPHRKSVGGSKSLQKRMKILPQGSADHTWARFDESVFDVRSETYLRSRKKAPSAASMLELVSVDFFRIGDGGPIWCASTHNDLIPQHCRRQGDRRFLFIQNWIFPPYQCVIVGALDPAAPWLAGDEETPQARVWRRFLAMSPDERKESFKVIMSVEQGPWLVKRAVPKKPLLIGRQVKMKSFHEPDEYLEIVVDVSAGRAELMATGMVTKALRNLKLAMAVLIEGKHEDELPECLLLCASMQNVDTSKICCPDEPSA